MTTRRAISAVVLVLFGALLLVCGGCGDATAAIPAKEVVGEAATEVLADDWMDWWSDAKFGMFIHWGLYSVPGRGEWAMEVESIPISKYEKYADRFDPVSFDADEWVSIAKDAGQKYLVITAKHHDGFCMWDSRVTDYDIVERTQFKRDVIRELADACERAGIAFGIYYSILDWHQPDARNGNVTVYRDEYVLPQIWELVANYDPDILWFDGDWQDGWSAEDAEVLHDFCKALDPTIVINDRIMTSMPEFGDYSTAEREIPEEALDRPWESCMTMSTYWGYGKHGEFRETPQTLVRSLVEIASKGGNLLLNVGPTGEGVIPTPSLDKLKSVGEWMSLYGDTIYGSMKSPIQDFELGRVTFKDGVYYLHLFYLPTDGQVDVPFVVTGSAEAFDYRTGGILPVMIGDNKVTIDVTGVEEDPRATVIEFRAQGEPVSLRTAGTN